MDKFWKGKTKPKRVIRTTVEPKAGFYTLHGLTFEGYRMMREDLIEENFEECTKEYYNQQKYKKETT